MVSPTTPPSSHWAAPALRSREPDQQHHRDVDRRVHRQIEARRRARDTAGWRRCRATASRSGHRRSSASRPSVISAQAARSRRAADRAGRRTPRPRSARRRCRPSCRRSSRARAAPDPVTACSASNATPTAIAQRPRWRAPDVWKFGHRAMATEADGRRPPVVSIHHSHRHDSPSL